MVKRTKLRWQLTRTWELYPARGLGVWYYGGNSGTTYGESGQNRFATVAVLAGLWTWELRLCWKEHH